MHGQPWAIPPFRWWWNCVQLLSETQSMGPLLSPKHQRQCAEPETSEAEEPGVISAPLLLLFASSWSGTILPRTLFWWIGLSVNVRCVFTRRKSAVFSPARYLPRPGSVQRIAHLRSLTERLHKGTKTAVSTVSTLPTCR